MADLPFIRTGRVGWTTRIAFPEAELPLRASVRDRDAPSHQERDKTRLRPNLKRSGAVEEGQGERSYRDLRRRELDQRRAPQGTPEWRR